jgi:hypothetical protein
LTEPKDPPLTPASFEEVVQEITTMLGRALPAEHLELLRRHSGTEGISGEHYVILWKAEELIRFNREYEIEKYAPGIFLFGSNGGGEAYGFDTQDPSMPVVRVPFVGMDRCYAEPVTQGGEPLPVPDGATASADHRRGKELFEIKPVILGGDPVDPANKTWLTREQHFELVRFWNKVIRDLREQKSH